MITMTRRLTFSAASYTGNLPVLQDDHNLPSGSPAAVSGHNYRIDVSVRGALDPRTGILVNIKEIDRIARERIVQAFDGKLINRDIGDFAQTPATPENLVAYFVMLLQDALPPGVRLSALTLEQTPSQRVQWSAEEVLPPKESGAMLLTRGYEFAASHRLHSPHLSDEENRELFGKCNYEHGHGHNYELEVTVAGPVDARSGRVLDPGVLDAIVNREVVDRYDHRHFNYDLPEFAGLIPSAEVITCMIWERLAERIPFPARLYRVLVRETARNIFEYYGEA
jgi:6-pyruvoyltetrahydropterin/6-carboxytetrahydropterin synthase